jgi:hypothetical protein
MNIQEGNKLIAEFMGCGEVKTSYATLYTEIPVNCIGETQKYQEALQWHESWDWLMPVVEKINSISIGEFEKFSFIIEPECCHIDVDFSYRGRHKEYLGPTATERYWLNVDGSNILESAYKAVVEFIKWYNEDNSK